MACERCGYWNGVPLKLLGVQERILCHACQREWDDRTAVQKLDDLSHRIQADIWYALYAILSHDHLTSLMDQREVHVNDCRKAIAAYIAESDPELEKRRAKYREESVEK